MSRLFDLLGKRALVTGASGGLGLYFATVLAQAGAEVVLTARRREALDAAAADLTSGGGSVSACVLDVCDMRSVEKVFDNAPFDIVVNNAGVTHEGPALETSIENWNYVMNTDLGGVFRVAQSAARQMKAHGRDGSIINISSILGLRVAGNVAAYAVAKAGVLQLTRALALEWARYGIRVNALCPGYIETDLNRAFFSTDVGTALIRRIPQRRLGQMSELAGPLLLLASDAGSFMTGGEIVADGGHLVSSL